MRFLCFFMASGHTKANYLEIVLFYKLIVYPINQIFFIFHIIDMIIDLTL